MGDVNEPGDDSYAEPRPDQRDGSDIPVPGTDGGGDAVSPSALSRDMDDSLALSESDPADPGILEIQGDEMGEADNLSLAASARRPSRRRRRAEKETRLSARRTLIGYADQVSRQGRECDELGDLASPVPRIEEIIFDYGAART